MYEVVGCAHGEVFCFGVLGLVLIGEAGFHAAYERACQEERADQLADYQADREVTSFLVFFRFVKFKVAGTAVRAWGSGTTRVKVRACERTGDRIAALEGESRFGSRRGSG